MVHPRVYQLWSRNDQVRKRARCEAMFVFLSLVRHAEESGSGSGFCFRI